MRKVTSSALRIDGLVKSFAGVRAVDDLSIKIESGRITGLIGPNGSGKSTTIDCITGFARPDSGKVTLGGRDITGLPAHQVALAGMTRTFQNVRVYERLSILENLLVAAQELRTFNWWTLFRGANAAAQAEETLRQRAHELLDLVSLSRLARAPAGILSYGQRKLVALGMSLMSSPKIIILDEPLAGVNPTIINMISRIVADLNARGQTFLIVEHNMDFIMKHCDRVIVLDSGGLLAEGPARVVREDERVLAAYLGGKKPPEVVHAGVQ